MTTAPMFDLIVPYTLWRQAVMPMLTNHGLIATGSLQRDPGREPSGLLLGELTATPRTGADFPPLADWVAISAPGGTPPDRPDTWIRRLQPRFAQLLVILLVGLGRNRQQWRGWITERGQVHPLAGLRIIGPGMVHAVANRSVDPLAIGDDARWSRLRGAVGESVFAKLRETQVAVIGCSRSGTLAASMFAALAVRRLTLIDPDAAMRAAAARSIPADLPKLVRFVPFDPATKMSEATAVDRGGSTVRIVKGAFAVVSSLTQPLPAAAAAADELEAQGFRVLAVGIGPPPALQLAGLIALSDPPRADSAGLITQLRTLGVCTVMVTGDAPATAAIVAHAVGLGGPVCPAGPIPHKERPQDFAVFAGVLPEGKYDLVKAFQGDGHTVGMCGDGANDAPALRQAQMGIAVSTATDVAKSAAGIVLTEPGLAGIVASVKEGRVTFQRILTYTLNSVNKKVVQVLFLAVGLIMTGQAILTPMLMVIIMITGDFLGMSLTTDNVRPSPRPNVWRIGRLTIAGVFMGVAELAFCSAVLAVGRFSMDFEIGALRTLAFVVIVFGNQATTYANRERRRLWSTCPSFWLVVSSAVDILIASTLATEGIFMTPVPILVVAGTLIAAVVFAFLVDAAKEPVFGRLEIS